MKKVILLILTLMFAWNVVFDGNSKQHFQVVTCKPVTNTNQEVPEIEFVTDKDKGLSKLMSLFDNSTYNIYICMYTLTNDKLINKIANAKNPNRQIFIILDYVEAQKNNDYKKLIGMKNIFIKFKRQLTKTGKIDTYYKYHKKIGIFDGKTIFTGSSNWTETGFYKNDEQNFIIKSKGVASKAKEEFLKEWGNLK